MVRIAGTLGIGFEQLFAGVANWHIWPLVSQEFLPGEPKQSGTNCSCGSGEMGDPKRK